MKRIAIAGLLLIALLGLSGCFINRITAEPTVEKFWTGWRDGVPGPIYATLDDSVVFHDVTGYITSPCGTYDEIVTLFADEEYWWNPGLAKSMTLTAEHSGFHETVYQMDVFHGEDAGGAPMHYATLEIVLDANLFSPKIKEITLEELD